MTADTTLECWLETKAGVSAKFIAQVIAACDEEMIGDVSNACTVLSAVLHMSCIARPELLLIPHLSPLHDNHR